jgi:hypothetical protein
MWLVGLAIAQANQEARCRAMRNDHAIQADGLNVKPVRQRIPDV